MNQLAELVQATGRRFDLDVKVKTLPNPRKKAEDHYYNPMHTGLLDLGLKPHYLTEDVLGEMMETVLKRTSQMAKATIRLDYALRLLAF